MSSFETRLFEDSHGSFDKEALLGIEAVLDEMGEQQGKDFVSLMNEHNIDLGKIKFDPNTLILNRVMYLEEYQLVDLTMFAPLAGVKVGVGGMPPMSEMLLRMIEQCKRVSDKLRTMKEKGHYEEFFSMIDKKFLAQELYDVVMDGDAPEKELSTGFMRGYIRMESGFEIFDEEFMEVLHSRIVDCPERASRIKNIEDKVENGYLKILQGSKTDAVEFSSWTTDESIAEFFANRFDGNGFVIEGKVHVEDIIDYYPARGESEVIALEDNVEVLSIRET